VSATAIPIQPVHSSTDRIHRNRWWILFVILAVEVMDLLDGTIVNVAAPTIRTSLGASIEALQWIAGGYALTFAIGLVTGGRLGDIFGRRRMFLIGVAGFTITSALCGLAVSPSMLIACRLVQGLFAAAMIPQGFGIVREAFPAEEVGKAFGMFGPVIGGSAVLGPIIGGLLVDGNLFGTGWRMIFLVNAPLGVVAFLGGARLLPESRADVRPTLDVLGALLVAAAIGLLVYPLIQGRADGWPAWTFAMLAAGAATLAAFVAVERGRERRGASPLVTMSIFQKRAYWAGLLAALVFFAGIMGLMFTFSLYLQIGNGYDAIHAGLAFIPWAVGTAAGATAGAAVIAPRFGRHALHAGLAIMTAGVVAMLVVVHDAAGSVSALHLAGPELLAGAGMGAMLSPLFDFVLAGVDDHEAGSASGVLNATQQLGGATGIALVGTLFFAVVSSHGMARAFADCLWVEVGGIAACALLVLLLPMRARAGAE
jgi:EmrB/QacA subfamily drug resistance transporter